MEGTRRESERTVAVERRFEWSRLESQFMSTAYERVWPGLGSGQPAGVGPPPARVEAEPEQADTRHQATGA